MKLVFEKEIRLRPEDSKKNVILPFSVDDEYERLEIHFSYSPKKLEDLPLARQYIEAGLEKYAPGEYRARYKTWESYLPVVNLITLSLDSSDGYAGCAHRHNPEQNHILSKSGGSPGFIPLKIAKGDWRAVINVHALVTEHCVCTLHVYGDSETEVLI